MRLFGIVTLSVVLIIPTQLLFAQESGEFDMGDEKQGMKEVPLENEELKEAQDSVSAEAAQVEPGEAVNDSEEGDGNFIPSEKINVDSEISFPVDI